MMTTEQIFFLHILKDHLSGEKSFPVDQIDWTTIARYAHIHQVDGILYYQCRDFMPNDILAEFEQTFASTLYRNKNREFDWQIIKDSFTKEGIKCFIVKGFHVASCYPIPALRTMGDIDVVVSREYKEKAGRILEKLGYTSGVKAPDYDWSYDRGDMHYELHHLLLYDEKVTKSDQATFFNDCWRYIKDGQLDWNFHFLFLLAHLQKHLMNSGAGFRMFMDIATIINSDPGLKWEWIDKKLKELKMDRFSRVCFSLIEEWFCIRAPIPYDKLSTEYVELITNKVFENGVFGFNDATNRNNNALNSIIRYRSSRGLSRMRMIVRYLFPKYIHMRYIPYYSFIEGRPWLLPVAWGYRLVRAVIGRENGIIDFVKRVSTPDDIINNREEELRLWGIIE